MGWEVYDVSRSMPGWAVNDFIDGYNKRVEDNLDLVRAEGRITGKETASRMKIVEHDGESYVLRERLFLDNSSEYNPWNRFPNSFSVDVYHPNNRDLAVELGRGIKNWFDEIESEIKGKSPELDGLFNKIESDVKEE